MTEYKNRSEFLKALREDSIIAADLILAGEKASGALDKNWDSWEAIGLALRSIDGFVTRQTNQTYRSQPYKKLYGTLMRLLPDFSDNSVDPNNRAALREIFITNLDGQEAARDYFNSLPTYKQRMATPRNVLAGLKALAAAEARTGEPGEGEEGSTKTRKAKAADLSLDPADAVAVNAAKLDEMVARGDTTRINGLVALRTLLDQAIQAQAVMDAAWEAAQPQAPLAAPLLQIEDATFVEEAPKAKRTRVTKAKAPKAKAPKKAKKTENLEVVA